MPIKLLFVEPDEGICSLFESILQSYHVRKLVQSFAAVSVYSAWKRIEEQGDIVLLITEWNVGGLTSESLIQGLIERGIPAANILLMASVPEEEQIEALSDLGVQVLRKPVELAQIRTFLDTRLAALSGDESPQTHN